MSHDDPFIFESFSFDGPEGCLALRYAYQDGPGFEERITFPDCRQDLTDAEQAALNTAFFHLHLAAGISYYKAFCPEKMIIQSGELDKSQAAFFDKFYLLGLGEFAVENDLDLRERIRFPVSTDIGKAAHDIDLPSGNIVPIGGGKDSLVSLETLRRADLPFRPFAVNAKRPILETIERSGSQDSIMIQRVIDPALFSLNDEGAYNGHVPITGILSFIMVAGSILYGYDNAILSNENSANEANMIRDGLAINHQYSKSFEFEEDFDRHVRTNILSNFHYFSLLRPLSESGITAIFATLDDYFDVFKSCNRNFHISDGVRQYGWCRDCPKCRFVFLALGPFLGRDKLIEIFGADMLDDASQEDGFRELCGLKGHKPFECVGEIAECRLLMKNLTLSDDWQNSHLVAKLAGEITDPALPLSTLKEQAFVLQGPHLLPPAYLKALKDMIDAA